MSDTERVRVICQALVDMRDRPGSHVSHFGTPAVNAAGQAHVWVEGNLSADDCTEIARILRLGQ